MDFKTDIVEKSDERLISQYSDAINLKAILEACSIHSQELEDTAKDLFEKRWLDTSTGDQLDRYGEILDADRLNLIDDIFRLKIKARIIRYQSSGQIANLISALKMIAGFDTVYIQESPPAAIRIFGVNEIGEVPSDFVSEVRDTINNAKGAGIGVVNVLISKSPPFAFSEYPLYAEGFTSEDTPDYGGWLTIEFDELLQQ